MMLTAILHKYILAIHAKFGYYVHIFMVITTIWTSGVPVRLICPIAVVAAAVACYLPASPAGAGPLTANWVQASCAVFNGAYPGAEVCLYYDTSDSHHAMGKLINHSSSNISNAGSFTTPPGQVVSCGGFTSTKSGGTSTCIKELTTAGWNLVDKTSDGRQAVTNYHQFG